ncbi:hypothetical protein [Dawidia soli]|uniref:PKD domain-containing protein n=1 Tax=Dawidia soli TaxID=2782352 RepID=A0AAP2DF76_9BACT|nr:hypothetical protein [Dawidia soli]MBT1688257.1 hypothetical protein [Dawidia soli]
MRNVILYTALFLLIAVTSWRCSDEQLVNGSSAPDHALDISSARHGSVSNLLVPAITMNAYIDFPIPAFVFSINGPSGAITVDWGDGTTDVWTLNNNIIVYHYYTAEGNYPVTVTGDLETVTAFQATSSSIAAMDQLDISALPALQYFELTVARGPAVVDLSHNTALNSITLRGSPQTTTLLLPPNHVINYVDISATTLSNNTSLPVATINALIDNIHTSVVNNPRSGEFKLADQSGTGWVGPPSPGAVTQLEDLGDNYSWTVLP